MWIVESVEVGTPIGYQLARFYDYAELCAELDKLIRQHGSVVVSKI